ncbi:MAG: hypothetical protein ACT4NT_01275 [Nitrososphaerota archaeon]
MKNYLLIMISITLASAIPLSFADQGTYEIEVDGETFDVSYNFDGELVAMDVDQESTSLLIGTTNVDDSTFEIGFQSNLLSAQNGEFIVLVDGLETDYVVTYDGDNPRITFPIVADSEEIEIIGTSVIPEFPFGALAIMVVVSTMAIVFSKTRLFK